jgi:Cupin-like domain
VYHCFKPDLDPRLLDREPFKFAHCLLEHPALSLENLGRVLPALRAEQVFYSKSTRDTGADLDRLHEDQQNGLSVEQTIENIRTSDSYIMVRSPETDFSFASLHKELLHDVEKMIRARGAGTDARESMLYLFIASPNSVTPFHIDRYSTVLMQFRGSKTVTIYPAWDKRVVDQQDCEDYVAYTALRGPRRRAEAESHGRPFNFSPGQALHVPFAAGHMVQNGSDDISISLSIIFKTAETERMRKAIMFNRRARQALSRFGFQPNAVGHSPWKDAMKAVVHSGMHQTAKLFRAR